VPEDGSPEDLAEARRRGSELQAGIPVSRRTGEQRRRAEVWAMLILPLAVLWIFVVAERSSVAVLAAVIGSLALVPLTWFHIRDTFRRGTRW
jgi:hypothetical protein